MKRNADNVSSGDLLAEQPGDKNPDDVKVMYGGCGWGAGTFTRPAETDKRSRWDILSLLGFKRNKSKEDKI